MVWKKILTSFLAAATILGCAAKKAHIMLETPPQTQYHPSSLEGKLMVGVGKEDITLKKGEAPLSGYGGRLENFGEAAQHGRLPEQRMNEGVHDNVYARAVIIDNGHRRIAIVSADILLINRELKQAVEKKVANLKLDDLLLCATHTHSSLGGYWKNWGWEFGTGKYDQKIFDYLTNQISAAIIEANSDLELASIGSTTIEANGFSKNREVKGGITDPKLGIIKIVDKGGNVKAYIVNFAAHATSISEENFLVSGDYPGMLERFLEEHAEVALFTSGAAANQRPSSPQPPNKEDPFSKPEVIGKLLAGKVLEASNTISLDDYVVINSVTAKIPLLPKKMKPLPVAGPLVKKYVRSDTFIQVIEIGDRLIMAVPGELGVEIGLDLKKATSQSYMPFVVTLANDHIGYIMNEESYKRKQYEYRLSFYGPKSGLYIQNQILGLVKIFGKI